MGWGLGVWGTGTPAISGTVCPELAFLEPSTSLILVPSLWPPRVGVWGPQPLISSLTASREAGAPSYWRGARVLYTPSCACAHTCTSIHVHMHRGTLGCRSPAGMPRARGCKDPAIQADTSRLDRNVPSPHLPPPARLCQSDPLFGFPRILS